MVKIFHVYITSFILISHFLLQFQATNAASTSSYTSAGPLIKQLSSILKWTSKSSPKSIQSDEPVVKFESGYLVETVVEGNALGVIPHLIRVSQDGELFAVDSENSNIVRVTPPLSQYSRARLVAGSFQGRTGHVDGKPSDARFDHPKGVTMDDKGNVYVADTDNLAIRKIGEGGVTTIAGGKSNVAGYRDGPSEDSKFSSDFDIVYVPSTCSLLVVDRGNAALRQISLDQEDCDANYSSISTSDVVMVIGAVFVGYASCLLHQGLGSSFFSKFPEIQAQQIKSKKKHAVDNSNNTQSPSPSPGWPSLGQLTTELPKLILETLNTSLSSFLPSQFLTWTSRKGLTPLKDTLKMPVDEKQPQKQKTSTTTPISESWHANPEVKASKIRSLRDPSLQTKHRSSKRPEYAEFYGSSEAPPHHVGPTRVKPQKDRSKHRHRDKSGEVSSGVGASEVKPSGGVNYMDPKFDPYNVRGRYTPDGSYRY